MHYNMLGYHLVWSYRIVTLPVWPFRSVAVSVHVANLVCSPIGLWPFRFVAGSVVAISECGHYNLVPYGLNHFSSLCSLMTKSMPDDIVNAIIQERFCAGSPNLEDTCSYNMVFINEILEKMHYGEIHN